MKNIDTLKQDDSFVGFVKIALIMLGIYTLEFALINVDYLILELITIAGYIFTSRYIDKKKKYDIKVAVLHIVLNTSVFLVALNTGNTNMRRCSLLGYAILLIYLILIINTRKSIKALIIFGCVIAISGIANSIYKSTYYGSYKNSNYIQYTPLEIVTMAYNSNYFVKDSENVWVEFLEQFGSMDYFEDDIVDSTGKTMAKLRYKWMTSDVYRYKIKFQIKSIEDTEWADYGEFYTNYNIMEALDTE